MEAGEIYLELDDIQSLLRDIEESIDSLMLRMREASDRHTDDGDDFCKENSRRYSAGRKSRYI